MLGMAKKILIASIIAGIAIMLLLSSQQAYAPPQAPRAAFSFHGTAASGFEVDGGGSWATTGSGKIAAGGTFLGLGTMGSWKAIGLDPTVGCCTPSMSASGSAVVFTAAFNGADKVPIPNKKVVVAAIGTDLDGMPGNGNQNFWVEGVGFGPAFDARFP